MCNPVHYMRDSHRRIAQARRAGGGDRRKTSNSYVHMAEKYAYMMQSTSPREFDALKGRITQITDDKAGADRGDNIDRI
jgi:hypothetical protein